jgi:acyl-CoA synthetase (AMP-forming)/AMP-acid ligase II/thioesterase domain-containing protein/acyl carrier protein/2-polyprenyl-3-methyl-5-hydroxy-6-metoxy-1,4-benzoquinol methylase
MSEDKCGLNAAGALPESMPQTIKFWAERNNNATAILAPGRIALTYGRLWKQIEGIVKALNRMEIGRNDRVALIVPDGPEMAVAILGIGSGTAVAMLNTSLSADEFDTAFADLRIRALVVQSGLNSPAEEVARARSIQIVKLNPSWEEEAGIFSLSGEEGAQRINTGLAEPDEIFTLSRTSGTTGHPRVSTHTHKSICTRARLWDSALQLSETDRCLNLMPLTYGGGQMNGLFATLLSGGSVVCPPAFLQSKFFELLEHFRPTRYICSASIHRAILDQAQANLGIIARCSLRFIGATSAALPRDLMERLEAVFNVPVIDMYSSTECGPVAVSPLPPGKRKPGSVGVAAGSEVAIMDEAGSFLPAGKVGEIVVRGPALFEGYENDPEANERSYSGGWFRMGDLGYLDDEGYLFLAGRLKEVINCGGQKVSPTEVNEALLGHSAVAEAEAFAIPHPRLGEEVAAVVVLHNGIAASERELRAFVAKRLARFKRPRRILIVDEIPKDPAGKVQRSKLAERFGKAAGLAGRQTTEYAPPRTQLEKQLADIWAEVLKIDRVGVQDDFQSLGGDSIQATMIVSRASEQFGITLPLDRFFEASTISQMAEIIAGTRSGTVPGISLVMIRDGGSKPPLFWLHGTDGAIFWYKDLVSQLSKDQSVYGIIPRGFSWTWLRPLRIEDMAARYIREIRALQPEGPYLLAGPSSAGVWAFEIARQLDEQGHKVGLVALLDSPCPGYLISYFRRSFPRKLWKLVQTSVQLGPKRGPGYFLTVVKKTVKYSALMKIYCFLAVLMRSIVSIFKPSARRIRALGQFPTSVSDQKNIAAACRLALSTYAPKPYRGRLVLFYAEGDSSTRSGTILDPSSGFGWSEYAAGGVDIHRVTDTHRGIFTEPHARVVARQMESYIAEALQTTSCESEPTKGFAKESTRPTQTEAFEPSYSSKLLDMRDCARPEWVAINSQLQKLQYRLQPQWFRPFFRSHFVRGKLGYEHAPRLWEYSWAVLSANIGRGMRVLDVGSGGSAFPLLLSKYGCEVHATDPSLNNGQAIGLLDWRRGVLRTLGINAVWGLPSMRRSRNYAVTYVPDPIQKLRYRDSYFDRVFCVSVMEHIPVHEWIHCMTEMSRVLSDGGRLVLTLTMRTDQANERWYEKLLGHPSLRLLGCVDYGTPIAPEDAQARHSGQAFETLGLVWEKPLTH